MSFLGISGLAKSYGTVTALGGIDLAVEKGEFVTLLGPSGSGKTTLLMAIGGFVLADRGVISLMSRDITRLDPEDRDLGLVFQGYALFPHMSVAENIAFPLEIRRWPRPRIAARVEEMLALVGLAALAGRRPRELSGGQQQRVALARALSFGPELLLLDEPLSALDRTLRESMQRELKRLHRETGVTFVYVTHDQEEAISMSDRIAVFRQGRIEQIGTPRQMYGRPATRFVAEFLGINNLFEGRVEAGPGGRAIRTFAGLLPIGRASDGTPLVAGAPATLWVRPEHASLAPVPEAVAVSAVIRDVAFLGAHDRLVLQPDGGPELIVQFPAGEAERFQPGARLTVHLPLAAFGVLPSA
ncbi:ABC transporter ATP-binding protein [Labrys wisconsinensis]|uniref:Spermidine/putrescine transport system ATP-binding protein n=1 Tax=Labrys wisconsinensis TaxID=425677 RepID=A0ABU0JER3_9HYPH|nr:ABC transporter ATP-binding protein [Labrys wisconsinensis]MDQ0471991.1 putative spermidine/putrescine transport system ATP-binding protein [Labrys wisconsinensis]